MNYKETCDAIEVAYKKASVEELRAIRDKAYEAYQTANDNYLEARDAYHQIYHKLWAKIKS